MKVWVIYEEHDSETDGSYLPTVNIVKVLDSKEKAREMMKLGGPNVYCESFEVE